MSVKLDSSLPPQVLRPEPRSPVAPSIAKGEPVPSARPGARTDGFERAAPGTPSSGLRGSVFEKAGAVGKLPRLGKYKSVADNLVKLASQDDKLRELAINDPQKSTELFKAALLTAKVPLAAAEPLAQECTRAMAMAGPRGSTILVEPRAVSMEAQTEIGSLLDKLGPSIKNLGDAIKVHDEIVKSVKPQEGDTPEAISAYTSLQLGKYLVDKGIEVGRGVFGHDGFHVGEHGGLAPGERLEDLPSKLEPHRDALEKLTDQMLRNPKLDNSATLRKALWSELKKLPFHDDGSRHDARQYLLEEFALRQDRFTE